MLEEGVVVVFFFLGARELRAAECGPVLFHFKESFHPLLSILVPASVSGSAARKADPR